MGKVISRRLEFADRFMLQQADQAIKRDVIRALVELVTNCDDSYRRIEDNSGPMKGTIVIEVQRKDRNSVLRITDFAEGMSGEDMDVRVGKYAEETSGLQQGQSVRGFWGRGLKDAVFGLGYGSAVSIKDGQLTRCTLHMVDGIPKYERYDPTNASNALRKSVQIPKGNGTIVEIVVSREEVGVPQIENLRRQLQLHYELRELMQNKNRNIVLRYLDSSGRKIKKEMELEYRLPLGQKLIDEELPIPGFDAKARLVLCRSEELLSTQAEEGDYAEAGFVVVSDGSAIGLSMLKFEGNEFAEKFYGKIECDYIRKLMERGEPITTATRDGLNWRSHQFAKALKAAVEKKVEPFIVEEQKKANARKQEITDKRLRERLERVVDQLNEIAKEELGKSGGAELGSGKPGKQPYLPSSGFGFVPEYYSVQVAKRSTLLLRAAVPDVIESGSALQVQSSSSAISVLTPSTTIERIPDFPGIGQAHIEIEGAQVGAEGIITASFDTLRADAYVNVISKRVPSDQHREKPERHGLVQRISFDAEADPKQRVYFRRADSTVVIATRAPSVCAYVGAHGEGSNTAQAQVIIAELVTEAVCKEIARRGVESQTFLSLADSTPDAVNQQYIRIQNQYAHRIHAALVDAEFRRSEEVKAVLPAASEANMIAA